MIAAATAGTPYPRAGYAWYTVVLLTVAYIFSFIDRYILGLLVEPIKQDMSLSDTQIGLLLGPAFALFYTTMGLPLGWLADRARRTYIVAAGIAVWSIATAASGLTKNFLQLFAARVAVGVGEATLSPCALSMIADSFPESRRGKPVAFYSAALSLGAGIASLAGATVLAWSATAGLIELPVIGAVKPWQLAFIVVGLPGVALAVLMLTLREPLRRDRGDIAADGNASLGDAFRFIRSQARAYIGFTALVCLMTIIAYSQGWLPAMFERTWGWPAKQYALVNGIVLLSVGPASVYLAGWASDRLHAQGRRDAPLLMVMVGVLLMFPTGALAPLMPSPETAFVVLAINTVAIAIISATAPTALMNITAGEVRGQVIAIYFIVISIAGLGIGPTSIGLLSDHVFGEENLRYAVAVMPLALGLIVLTTMPGTLKSYRAVLDKRASTQ